MLVAFKVSELYNAGGRTCTDTGVIPTAVLAQRAYYSTTPALSGPLPHVGGWRRAAAPLRLIGGRVIHLRWGHTNLLW